MAMRGVQPESAPASQDGGPVTRGFKCYMRQRGAHGEWACSDKLTSCAGATDVCRNRRTLTDTSPSVDVDLLPLHEESCVAFGFTQHCPSL